MANDINIGNNEYAYDCKAFQSQTTYDCYQVINRYVSVVRRFLGMYSRGLKSQGRVPSYEFITGVLYSIFRKWI